MTDPRPDLLWALARWLALRARVRALAQSLAANEYAVRGDARRCGGGDEPELGILAAQLREERAALELLGAQFDRRIADHKRDIAIIEAAFVGELRAEARATLRRS